MSMLSHTPQDHADLERIRAMGIDPDAPDALSIGPGGIDLLPRPDEHEVVTAQSFLTYVTTQMGVPQSALAVHPWVLATFQRTIAAQLVEATASTPSPGWQQVGRRVWHGTVGQAPVTIIRLNIGAPVAITGLEELIATGGQRFVVLGTAGALQTNLAVGSFVLPTGTIREEGTSFHYAPAGTDVAPDGELVRLLLDGATALGQPVAQGSVWTTDAPYRELASKIQAYRALGVLAVEMEAAAMFALAALRGVRLALLVAISDHLDATWHPAFLDPRLTAASATMVRIALHAITRS